MSCEYQRSIDDNSRVTLKSKKFPIKTEKIQLNNDIIKFVSVNSSKGIINFYLLINFRKIKSKDKTKDNFIKIPLHDIGLHGEKKYKETIVNDIQMEFSIKLIQKSMNYNIIEDGSKITITIKKRGIRNNRKNKVDKLNNSFEKEKASDINSKLPIFKKLVNAALMATKIKRVSSSPENIIEKETYEPPPKVEEIHEEPTKVEDMFSINNPYLKNLTMKSEERKEEREEKEDENKRLRGMHGFKNYLPGKNKTLTQMITAEKRLPNKLKTISTEEILLEPINYEKYLIENNPKDKKTKHRETFCEGFFISSFPQKDGQVIEKSQSFPSSCGHKECSSLPAMKPEIILRYPLEDTKTLEMNNLAATICFPTGIKVCYSENEPEMIKDFVTPITNQKGERYYMVTYHFYLKMANDIYSKIYEMHPLKHHLMKFADNYLNMSENQMNKKITEQIHKDLERAQNLGFRDFVFVPYCISLISKYPYVTEMKKCLHTIYNLIINNNDKLNDEKEKNKINYFIMHIINSVPIPDMETRIQFYLPYFSKGIELKCPKLNDLKIMNTTISDLFKLFSIDYIIYILRFLIFEKKILFIDDDYTRLTSVTDNFISLLYPFQWMHTYIPIMSDQMLKYLETFLPFINGIHSSLMTLVSELFETGEMEEGEEMFLIYINKNKLKLGSSLTGKNKKLNKYIDDNVPELPANLEKELRNKLKKLKEDIENFTKKNPYNSDLSEFDLKIRNAFIELFVKMFHDIDKYLCFLDDDVVFNKNLFLETISKEDKKFYDEFIDTQLFQLFCQNFVNDEFDYFKSMINEYNTNKKFLDEEEFIKKYIKKIYILNPDYLGINEKSKKDIEMKIKEKYNIAEYQEDDELPFNDKRITEYIQKIDDNNYKNKECNIYLMPAKEEKKEKTEKSPLIKVKKTINLLTDMLGKTDTNEISKNYVRTKTNKNEMSEKDKDSIKERIKDFTVSIFKSEEIKEDAHFKKELQNDINTNFGREFFVNLLAKNTSNIILLKDNSFNLLGTLIYNTLLYILQVEENSKILEQIVILIKCTMFFGIEEKETIGYFLTEQKKNTITLWNKYKQKLQGYPKVNQANLWFKWYQIDLNSEKEQEGDKIKKKVILKLCDVMIELELIKSFIKNTLEKLIEKVFGDDKEKNKSILNEIIQKIIKTKYISKAKDKI